MEELLAAFVDELEKISVSLTPKEERRQALQFGALGAASVPAVSAITNKIEHGSFVPAGSNKGRWLGARLVGGALTAGALPVLRHHLEQKNLANAKERRKAGKV